MNTSPLADIELPESATRIIGRFYFGTNAAASLASAAVLWELLPGAPLGLRLALGGSVALFALLCVLALRFGDRPRFPMRAALCGAAVVAMALNGVFSALLGDGLRSPPLAFCGVIVCVVGSITRGRCGLALAAFAALEMALLAWLDARGMIHSSAARTPLLMVLLYQWLVVLCGAIGGSLISRVIQHYLRAAAEREQRFRGLLRIAADWYWEQDRQFRFTAVARTGADADDGAPAAHADTLPWEPSRMGLDDEQLDAHRADLEAHRPFDRLLARGRDAGGQWRTISVSGAPKFDAAGAFRGYWGVARDVTDEVLAQRALAASEARYRELFTRSPSPLFLHRRGIVFDANEAAARLFGFASAAAMNGLSIVTLFPDGTTRDSVAERLAELEQMALGEGLPVVDLVLRALDGRLLSVQATAVRVDTVSGPANLSIFFDITARKGAEDALRRSEAMLSHLFATSPDSITLTETATGRFAIVNASFSRLTGYSRDELIGHSAIELGVWHDPQDRTRLLARLERDGKVADMPVVIATRSGAQVPTLLSAGRFVMDRRDYLVLNIRDVTDTERTRQQHTAILEHASIGIAFTRDGRFLQANPFFERMFGWDAGMLPGQPGAVVWASEADYREIGLLAGPLLSVGKPFEAERQVQRRDGSRFWCRLLAQAIDRNDPGRGGTIWIAEDVTERRRLDAALAAARDASEAASRAKSAFLANTSHEIRTPLNGLLGLARLAMQPDVPAERRQQYLAHILDSAQALAGIMSDILDVSKIEAGKLALDDAPFDLRDTLESVHHAYEPLAQAKGLPLLLALDERLPATVHGDAVRLRQILSNFITNALKFTERGHVRLEASRTDAGTLRLAVSDTGPGVDAATQARLFQRFSQGDSSTTRRFGGTGLGLSICRDLAQLMGGTVGLDSAPGQGSTFWAELPLAGTVPAPHAASTEATDLARLAGAHVLMVEDNPVNMMIAVAMLEHWGVRVEQAADGRAAVDAVHAAARRGQPFDLVLMDVQMPVMGGHEAARELRRHYDADTLPIVALTAAALVSERAEALAAGMDDFLTKPIDATRLRQTIAGLVQRCH
ncbi:MAG: PAS domain S-box protein [Burkholderiaceae bacterium]